MCIKDKGAQKGFEVNQRMYLEDHCFELNIRTIAKINIYAMKIIVSYTST